ncbi:MAG: hypothetical protein A3I11_04890 [Elusimicrobia bacterium RIFCSPLOWO2_02_FULL_39_32]|nr:MAG: hypothetical protein A3B80_00715 [Elusimicrobia bacterium RIFCSPHIGHO2_02_FULL_39_36]OGR91095.1 MAG: hypothetical protein A3I11_04890 [Elusimicrobia bacterium RIFCSPLOWO2_02_FULL_39_32]OGS00062.1 MAG: hypothetical protein A3G85_07855 [Elusimicrobia bacterium RIFCSPLOWO2_12_FULL_39_28]
MSDSKKYFIDRICSLLKLPANSLSGNENEISALFPLDEIPFIIKRLLEMEGARLVFIGATDDRKNSKSFGLQYLFSIDKESLLILLRSKVPDHTPKFPSIAVPVTAAAAFEQEISEFFGMIPQGHPNLKNLLLHEDWPSETFPLRKDFDPNQKIKRVEKKPSNFLQVTGEGVFEIPVGPVHAGIIEPGHFRFSVAGEPVIHLEIQLGFAHKGIEKLAEGKTVLEAVCLAERISGDASFAHSLAFCQAVEKIAKVTIPKKAQVLRVIFSEMERLYNHLGDIAGIATDVGFSFGAAQMLRLRELILQKNDCFTGHRLLRGIVIPGGVACDLTAEMKNELRSFLNLLLNQYNPVEHLYFETDSLMDRIEGTGVVLEKVVRDLAGVGPVARASNVKIDLRQDFPYADYPNLKFEAAFRKEGDVAARMFVKMAEFKEAISIIFQALDHLTDEPLSVNIQSLPEGSALGWAESARGEIFHWLRIDRDGKIDRLKIKSPSFSNWRILPWAVQGNIVPDFPLINKSFNLSYSGNDR